MPLRKLPLSAGALLAALLFLGELGKPTFRLKTVLFRTTLLPGNRQLLALGTLTVPRNARGGTYYLAFVARDRTDRVQSNNSAWSNWNVTVSVE